MADFLSGLAARVASLSADEAAVARTAFRALLGGARPCATALAAMAGLPTARADAAVATLRARGMLTLDDAGHVLVARGLSVLPTRQRLCMAGAPPLYAGCAVDAVAIPAALGTDARVEAACQTCETPLALVFRGGELADASPAVAIWAVDLEPTSRLGAPT